MTRVAIVGGGYSGTAMAIALARAGAEAVLIERDAEPGRGVAYGTDRAEHLLNVRASGMSAYADMPDHFALWFAERGGLTSDFAPRRLYGSYLQGELATAVSNGRIEVLTGEATAFEDGSVHLADGSTIPADVVILATGNLPPDRPRQLQGELADSDVYAADPWAGDISDGLDDRDDVLLLGTGLTAVDAAVTLDAAGFRGRILALSRRGLRPRPHAATAGPPPMLDRDCPAGLVALLRFVRSEAGRIGWRGAVDQLRPITIPLWRDASEDERGRFLRHLRPWWDVHRHRIAPEISARLDAIEGEGRLRFAAGKLVSAIPDAEGAEIVWRRRGAERRESLRIRRMVNCTGPMTDVARAGDPLLDSLLAGGRARPDRLRLGLDVDAASRVIDAAGRPSDRLYAIGPLARAAFWEIVAVPDIRRQVKDVAERITARS